MLLLLLNHFSRVQLCATPEMAAHQAPCPWNSPGKNTGVGCHFLLQLLMLRCLLNIQEKIVDQELRYTRLDVKGWV